MSGGGLFKQLGKWDPGPLRQSLMRAGFHREGLAGLGLPEKWLRSRIPRAALLGHAPSGSPVHTLIRLFTLGDPVDGRLALSALGDAVHGLLDIGFLEAGHGLLRSLHQLSPVADDWVAYDFQSRQLHPAADHVMGVGPSSLLLASLTPVREGGRALEPACGIAWLSGRLARAGMEVVASDLSARAVDLARFNARLNGHGPIDFRVGDGFSAIDGGTYDLIALNPPYVQSPGGPMVHREAAVDDSICARLVGEIPRHLAPGGVAVVLINWTHSSDDDWRDTPLSWLPATGLRRWLFQSDCMSPADYAWKWIDGDPRFADEDAAVGEIDRWLAHYEAIGARRVSGGFMVIERCAEGGEWTRADSRSIDRIGSDAGMEVMRVLANQTWLEGNPDLLECRFTVPDGIVAEAAMDLGAAGWSRRTIRLTSPARLSYDGQIDENVLRLLAMLREDRVPAMMVDEIRGNPAFAGVVDLPQRIADLVRELVSHGMLVSA